MVDAVLFDLANTLLNYDDLSLRPLFVEGARDTYGYLESLGSRLPDFNLYKRSHLRAFQRRYIWSSIRRRDFDCMEVVVDVLHRLDIQLPQSAYPALAWEWYQPAARRASMDPGTLKVLSNLREQGIKMAIISNTLVPRSCLDRHLENVGLLEYFPVRIYSSMTGYRKPHAEIFRRALDELQVPPERAVFVGDRLTVDIRGAQRVGMKTIWKPSRQLKTGRFRDHGADQIIRHIADLQYILPEFGIREWAAA